MKSARRVPALSGNSVIKLGTALIVWHELFCAEGELISEEVDRKRLKHPFLVPVVIVVTAAHLLRRLPPKADPYAWLGNLRMKGTPV